MRAVGGFVGVPMTKHTQGDLLAAIHRLTAEVECLKEIRDTLPTCVRIEWDVPVTLGMKVWSNLMPPEKDGSPWSGEVIGLWLSRDGDPQLELVLAWHHNGGDVLQVRLCGMDCYNTLEAAIAVRDFDREHGVGA